MGRGKGALASPLRLQRTTSTPTYRASFLHVWPQKPEGAAYDSGGHAALQAGLRALSSVFLLWQSPHSAAGFALMAARDEVRVRTDRCKKLMTCVAELSEAKWIEQCSGP